MRGGAKSGNAIEKDVTKNKLHKQGKAQPRRSECGLGRGSFSLALRSVPC